MRTSDFNLKCMQSVHQDNWSQMPFASFLIQHHQYSAARDRKLTAGNYAMQRRSLFVHNLSTEKISTASLTYQRVPKMFKILRHLKCIMHRAAEAHHSELSRCSQETAELPLPDQKTLAKASAWANTVHQLYHLDLFTYRSIMN